MTASSRPGVGIGILLAALIPALASAEIVFLKNGDVIRGTLTGATRDRITLQTAYGRLVIPKADVLRIEVEGEGADEGKAAEDRPSPPPASTRPPAPPQLALEIRGRSFWYAFQSSPSEPMETGIRLRIFLADTLAATLLDSKPDTVDGNTYYNSFTFSPTDSRVVGAAEGYSCEVVEAEGGRVLLKLGLPASTPEGRLFARMVYEINEGSRDLPRWLEAVNRSFSIPVKAGNETHVVLEQNADGLEYSGFFRKRMKNLESFALNVLSASLREAGTDAAR